jgi:cytochrome oxidase Cu insertion factor (SCO1/SenC/PrrC family)
MQSLSGALASWIMKTHSFQGAKANILFVSTASERDHRKRTNSYAPHPHPTATAPMLLSQRQDSGSEETAHGAYLFGVEIG